MNEIQLAIGIAFFFGLFGAAIILFILYHNKKTIQFLNEKQIAEQTFKNKLLESIIKSEEDERKRIAEDIHDGIGPVISVIKFSLENLISESTDDSASKLLSKTHDNISNLMLDLRKVYKKILPNTLENDGLITALEQYCETIYNSKGIIFNMSSIGVEYNLNLQKMVLLFRVCQEVLHNILKYSEATEVNVHVEVKEAGFFIEIHDNGIGFSQESFNSKLNSQKGFGLKSIQNRLQLINGNIKFELLNLKGTRTTIIADIC